MTQIDKNQSDESKIKIALEYGNNIIATLREPFLVLNKKLRVISTNQAFYTTFKVAEKDTIGRPLSDLGDRQWNIPKLIQLLKEIIPEKKVVKDYEIEHKFEQIGQRAMLLNACQLRIPKKIAAIIISAGLIEEELILLAIEDITERKHLMQKEKEFAAAGTARAKALEESKAELEKKVIERTDELRKAYDKLKFTQNQLIQAEKMSSLGIMAAGVAHELNNPLGGILGLSSLLSTILPEDNPYKKNIEEILKAARRCKAIVANLLKFSRKEAFAFHPVNINMVVENALILISHQEELANIKIIKNLAPDIPSIMANAPQLQQVFINIINNACAAMAKGGNLTVSTKLKMNNGPEKIKDFPGLSPRNFEEIPEGKKVEICFTDTGEGIPENIIDRIFDPFVTTKPVGKGTGLGLSVSYEIIEKHNGTIDVQSEEGKGTTFTIILPAKDNGN